MADESLADLLERLERERLEADRRYNDALTALDRIAPFRPELPAAPVPYDDTQLAALNERWDIVSRPPDGFRGAIKGRIRRLVWNLVGPVFGAQQRFNAALVDHLNRNARAHHEARLASAAALEALRRMLDDSIARHAHLIQYLQTVTAYIDTRDRTVRGQARVVAAGLSAVAEDAMKRWESVAARDERFMARVAALDDVRATASLAQQTALALKREVERVVRAGGTASAGDPPTGTPAGAPHASQAPPDLDAYRYLEFEDAFRGSQAEIRRRLADYVDRFAGLADVIDVGCGRGEFLALLAERGIAARGVDLNPAMVDTARARGLDVCHGDALAYLQALEDASIGGVFAAQVAEHLEPAYLERLIETAQHKLRPGGLLVLETINVACWAAFFDSYVRDLTHVRPLHPDTLQFVVRASGFHTVDIEYRSPVPEHLRLESVPIDPGVPEPIAGLARALNDNAARLNARMFTHQDYAVIGRK